MFKQLSGMMVEGDALIVIFTALKGGLMGFTVQPKGDFKNKALGEGFSGEATPQELDEELPELVERYVNKRKSLREQVEAAELVLDAAKDAVTATVAKATAKGAKKPAASAVVAPPATKDAGGEDHLGDDLDGVGSVNATPGGVVSEATPVADGSGMPAW